MASPRETLVDAGRLPAGRVRPRSCWSGPALPAALWQAAGPPSAVGGGWGCFTPLCQRRTLRLLTGEEQARDPASKESSCVFHFKLTFRPEF